MAAVRGLSARHFPHAKRAPKEVPQVGILRNLSARATSHNFQCGPCLHESQWSM